jgi:hypothetical protein
MRRLAQHACQPPQANGVEAADDEFTFRSQHPLDFAQDLVRLTGAFEQVRQEYQVE